MSCHTHLHGQTSHCDACAEALTVRCPLQMNYKARSVSCDRWSCHGYPVVPRSRNFRLLPQRTSRQYRAGDLIGASRRSIAPGRTTKQTDLHLYWRIRQARNRCDSRKTVQRYFDGGYSGD